VKIGIEFNIDILVSVHSDLADIVQYATFTYLNKRCLPEVRFLVELGICIIDNRTRR